MSRTYLLLLVVGLATVKAQFPEVHPHFTVCNYRALSSYPERNAPPKMDSSKIDNSLCTYLVYSSPQLNKTTFELILPDNSSELADLKRFVANKGTAKALLRIDDVNDRLVKAYEEPSRTAFVRAIMAALEKYHLDGVLLRWSWLYQTSDSLAPFVQQFETEKYRCAGYILGLEIGSNDASVNVAKTLPFVDFFSVYNLFYDKEYTKDPVPVYSYLYSAARAYAQYIPRSKMVLATPLKVHVFSARTYKDMFNPSVAEPLPVDLKYYGTGLSGTMTQPELCSLMSATSGAYLTTRHNWKAKLAYAALRNITSNDPEQVQVFAYVDINVMGAIARNVSSEGFGGLLVDSLEYDDYDGACGLGKFPLLRAVNDNYLRYKVVPEL